jgi:hypothetical protein
MSSAVRRPFAAERRKKSVPDKDVTIAGLMQKFWDLEAGSHQGFAIKFDRLCE